MRLKTFLSRVGVFLGLAVSLSCFVISNARADATRSQSFELQAGWNAVFLEVEPSASRLAELVDDKPIDIIAAYVATGSRAQFVTDPSVSLLRQGDWGVWYAESRPEAFLATLTSLSGQQAYLVHAQAECVWTVTGLVVPPAFRWIPDSYNFAGFSLSPQAPPTFAQFFAGSKAHRHNRIYCLRNGGWRRISDPSAEPMKSGEAFWIFCEGTSKYQGPLRVDTPMKSGLLLGRYKESMVLRNQTDHPLAAKVEHVSLGSNWAPLSIVIQSLVADGTAIRSISAEKPDGSWTQALPPLESGQSVRVPLEARLEQMIAYRQDSVLRITTDLGTEVWIPVSCIREDLKEN